jgi:hypothetical protein
MNRRARIGHPVQLVTVGVVVQMDFVAMSRPLLRQRVTENRVDQPSMFVCVLTAVEAADPKVAPLDQPPQSSCANPAPGPHTLRQDLYKSSRSRFLGLYRTGHCRALFCPSRTA